MGSVFGGVHVNPNVDVFAGGTYRTQENYKDGTGYEVANTGNRLNSGIGKLTVRPADGHEVKLGAIFQENIYSVGQPPRLAGIPTRPTRTAPTTSRHVDLRNQCEELHHHARLEIFEAGRPVVRLGCEGLLESYRQRSGQDGTHEHGRVDLLRRRSRKCGLRLIGSNRGYLLDTVGVDVYNTTRFETDDWRHAVTYGLDAFQDKVSTEDIRGTSEVTTPGGRRTVSGGFVQWKANYTSMLEVVGALRYDNYKL